MILTESQTVHIIPAKLTLFKNAIKTSNKDAYQWTANIIGRRGP